MKYWRTLTFLLGIIFSFATVLPAQNLNNTLPVFDKELLQQDFITFRTSLEKIHPALYRYKSQSEIVALMDSCSQAINHDMTQIAFYKLLKFVLSAIEDGHLASNIPDTVRNYVEKQAKVFPLKLTFTHNKVYILCHKNNIIPPGSELLAINNEPIEQTRQLLYQYIVSDGATQTNKTWVLSNSFWFYYLLVYGEKPLFTIQYRNGGGKIETISVPSDTQKNTGCKGNNINTGKKLQLTYKLNSTALLTIKTFSQQELEESKEDFTTFLKTSFTEIKAKKIKNLIIDLRGNPGGRDVYGSLLYSYLTNEPFAYYKTLATIDKTLSKEDHPNLNIQLPSEHNFKGKVFILIDGLSLSTTAEFCAIAKSNNRGIFIGEETGGGYYGNNSGHFIDVLLPHTEITLYIPATKYVMDVKEAHFKDRGIIPDFAVEPTGSDLRDNRDAQLNLTLKLIEKAKAANPKSNN